MYLLVWSGIFNLCSSQISTDTGNYGPLVQATELEFGFWRANGQAEKANMLRRKAEMFANERMFDRAYDAYLRIAQVQPYSTLTTDDFFLLASYAYMAGHYEKANSHLVFLLHKNGTSASFDHLGMAALVNARLGEWEDSRDFLKEALAPVFESPQKLEQVLDSIYDMDLKSRRAAKNLSLIPGLGQAYAGFPAKGTGSLALVAAGAAYAVLSFTTGYPVTAVLTGLGSSAVFFTGGMKYAQHLAARKNETKKNALIKRIKKILFIYRTKHSD